jgi:hypothetical protein
MIDGDRSGALTNIVGRIHPGVELVLGIRTRRATPWSHWARESDSHITSEFLGPFTRPVIGASNDILAHRAIDVNQNRTENRSSRKAHDVDTRSALAVVAFRLAWESMPRMIITSRLSIIIVHPPEPVGLPADHRHLER